MGIKLFYSYSHKDERFRETLETHLSILKRQGFIETWSDRKISPGAEWKEDINTNLEKARIVLLLVSENFLASDYCYETETIFALEQHDRKKCVVIPIIIKPCLFSKSRLNHLQALPKDAKPITKWRDRGEGWVNVAEGIIRTIENNPHLQTSNEYEKITFGSNPKTNLTPLNGEQSVEQVLVRFLGAYKSWFFSPLRIQKWGSKQKGFDALANYKTTQIRTVLNKLQTKGLIKTTQSKKGNLLFKMA